MSFEISASHVIPEIVEAMLPRGTRDKVLIMTMRARVAHRHGEHPEKAQTRTVHFLFYRPNNYTKVGLHIADSDSYPFLEKEHVWNVVSDHDSCWRGDGVDRHLFRLFIDLCRQVDPSIAPVKLDATLRFEAFCGIEILTLEDSADAVRYVRPSVMSEPREWTIQFTYAPQNR